VEEEIKSGTAKAQNKEDRVKIWVIAGILVIAGVALYYFLSYKQTEPQHQIFEFVSGIVVAKDFMNRTITIRADDGQSIPMGAQKRFFIGEDTIIQKIFLPDPNRSDTEARFEDAVFEDIMVGKYVTLQGEFSDTAAKEEGVVAVSIMEEEIRQVDKISNVPSALVGTIIKIGADSKITLEAHERQAVSPGSIKTAAIFGDTVLQKVIRAGENETKFEEINFADLKEGQTALIQFGLDDDLTKQEEFKAYFVTIL